MARLSGDPAGRCCGLDNELLRRPARERAAARYELKSAGPRVLTRDRVLDDNHLRPERSEASPSRGSHPPSERTGMHAPVRLRHRSSSFILAVGLAFAIAQMGCTKNSAPATAGDGSGGRAEGTGGTPSGSGGRTAGSGGAPAGSGGAASTGGSGGMTGSGGAPGVGSGGVTSSGGAPGVGT